jgi:hypothetical protein
MSEENVETVRAIYRAFARAESAQFARVEWAQFMEFLDPEIEFLINPQPRKRVLTTATKGSRGGLPTSGIAFRSSRSSQAISSTPVSRSSAPLAFEGSGRAAGPRWS